MGRTRRNAEETLELKIEAAEKKVFKTREAHERAVDELKKLYDIRKARQKDLIMKAMENSSRSFDEIIAFISSSESEQGELE